MKRVYNSVSPYTDEMPAYVRVKAGLRERIQAGTLSAGEQLPTQAELGRQFSVSRITIVRALQELEVEGLIERKQGVGTFVRRLEAQWSLTSASQLYKQTFKPEERPVHVLVALEEVFERPAHMRMDSALAKMGPFWRVIRLRLRFGKPVSYEESFIPSEIVRTEESLHMLEERLLFDYLIQECRVVLKYTRVHVSATTMSEQQTKFLEGAPGDPALLIARVTYGLDEQPVTFSLNTLPADTSSYYFEFQHDPASEEG